MLEVVLNTVEVAMKEVEVVLRVMLKDVLKVVLKMVRDCAEGAGDDALPI